MTVPHRLAGSHSRRRVGPCTTEDERSRESFAEESDLTTLTSNRARNTGSLASRRIVRIDTRLEKVSFKSTTMPAKNTSGSLVVGRDQRGDESGRLRRADLHNLRLALDVLGLN
jgi:hypothetical protein